MRHANPLSYLAFPALFVSLCTAACAQSAPSLTVNTHDNVSSVSPRLYGLMTEEINYSYEGGLYPEMVRNGTFQASWMGFEHWRIVEHGVGRVELKPSKDGPSQALPRSLDLQLTGNTATSWSGVSNEGWWGYAVRPNTEYKGSFYAKAAGANTAHARLVSDQTGVVLAQAEIPLTAGDWKQYTYTLHSEAIARPSVKNHFEIVFDSPGEVRLQLASLFPPTYHDRPNGMRPDLMEKLAAMNPKFLRMPGGNYLEGDTFAERFNWKNTVGPRVDRPGHKGPWNYESTDGFGLLEFLGWTEDLHMEPVLAVFAGFSLKGEHVSGKQLQPFIQDDLDEIEYVIGDTNTKWGAQRAKDGHPAPFPLHYVEIGNEDEFDKSGSYNLRFPAIAAAIRARYPQLQLIATTPVTAGHPDVIDDHYYKSPQGMFDLVHHYDTADRKGPKVFVGEWATREGAPTPDFGAALGDAALMTSMERNSDLIIMSSYAPLLVNVNPGGMQWETDLIGYNAMGSYGSPAYWAQVLFANHLGDHTVRTTGEGLDGRFFWSATVSTDAKILHLKLVNASDIAVPLTLNLEGVKSGPAHQYTLHGTTTWTTDTMSDPDAITPQESEVKVAAGNWKHTVDGGTIEVLDIPLQ